MIKRNTIFKTLLLTFLLILTCSSCFMLTACKEESTVYTLYQFEGEGDIYEIGDNFYGMKLDKNFVVLTLKEDGNAELKISRGFINGNPNLKNEYYTYEGTYTETDTEINALFPEFNSSTLISLKAGNLLTIRLGYENIILKK